MSWNTFNLRTFGLELFCYEVLLEVRLPSEPLPIGTLPSPPKNSGKMAEVPVSIPMCALAAKLSTCGSSLLFLPPPNPSTLNLSSSGASLRFPQLLIFLKTCHFGLVLSWFLSWISLGPASWPFFLPLLLFLSFSPLRAQSIPWPCSVCHFLSLLWTGPDVLGFSGGSTW